MDFSKFTQNLLKKKAWSTFINIEKYQKVKEDGKIDYILSKSIEVPCVISTVTSTYNTPKDVNVGDLSFTIAYLEVKNVVFDELIRILYNEKHYNVITTSNLGEIGGKPVAIKVYAR